MSSTTSLVYFASGCRSLATITLGENFGQNVNIPAAGTNASMFYLLNAYSLTTNVNGTASDAMAEYKWEDDHRIVAETYTFEFDPSSSSINGFAETE